MGMDLRLTSSGLKKAKELFEIRPHMIYVEDWSQSWEDYVLVKEAHGEELVFRTVNHGVFTFDPESGACWNLLGYHLVWDLAGELASVGIEYQIEP